MTATFIPIPLLCNSLSRSCFHGDMNGARSGPVQFCKRARQVRFGRKASYTLSARMCAKSDGGREVMELGGVVDDLKSDSDYVVVDGKDVESLISEMQRTGEDALLAFEDEQELFFQLAEKLSDEREGRTDEADSPSGPVMEYFTDSNLSHMPKWAREAYEKGSHLDLEKGSMKVAAEKSQRRLHAIVDNAKDGGSRTGLSGTEGAGIFDCTVSDVASDYGIPVELVTDILIEFGVKTPIALNDLIQEKLMQDEIENMLNLITSFDSQDLSDRYSDRSILELADDYDLDVGHIEQLCEDEGIYLAVDQNTRLQLSREDRVLDILLNEGAKGKPYPSLLEGLVRFN